MAAAELETVSSDGSGAQVAISFIPTVSGSEAATYSTCPATERPRVACSSQRIREATTSALCMVGPSWKVIPVRGVLMEVRCPPKSPACRWPAAPPARQS